MTDLGKAFEDMGTKLNQLHTLETYAMHLVTEGMKTSTEHFTRTELHYENDALIAKYKCSLDERTYTVQITSSR